jgi:hypothetical protein
MADARNDEPMMDVARGDKAVSQFLRESLKALRDGSEDKDFRRLIDDVLNGQMSLREAAASDLFERGFAGPLHEGMRRYDQLPESERARLAAEGEAEFARLNQELEERQRQR